MKIPFVKNVNLHVKNVMPRNVPYVNLNSFYNLRMQQLAVRKIVLIQHILIKTPDRVRNVMRHVILVLEIMKINVINAQTITIFFIWENVLKAALKDISSFNLSVLSVTKEFLRLCLFKINNVLNAHQNALNVRELDKRVIHVKTITLRNHIVDL
jgi:hypothetical protein